ncbi:MAG: LLM class F420-dependent oxidoreductase [Kouleothrix sp.]|nr:LLM class F420-dependent oxidoreductase [Kouleothrix sp.]
MGVKIGVFVPQGWKMDLVGIADPVEQYEAMTRVAQAADELLYDSIWVYDHFHTVPQPTMETTFEAWTTTAALTRDTKRVKVGQMVTCNGYRSPALLAKMASTVDVMSHGRLICGLGAGWYEHEWRAYGYGFPDIPVRMAMFREACEIIYRMWTEDRPTFQGKHYTIDAPINQPQGARKPHPEFWLGGGGEKVTLKLVAKYADGCNLGGGNPDTIRQKLEVLRRHCDDVGRDFGEITLSTSMPDFYLPPAGADPSELPSWAAGKIDPELFRRHVQVVTADQAAAQIEAALSAGANYIIVYLTGAAYDPDLLRRFSDQVVARFV